MKNEYIKEIDNYLMYLIASLGDSAIYELKNITPFSLCLKFFRNKNNYSQKELADFVSISENSIYNYENAKSRPTKNNQHKIMNFLNITDEDLLMVENIIFKKRSQLEKEIHTKENENLIFKNLKNELPFLGGDVITLILDDIFQKKELSLEDLEKVINGYRMINTNYNYEMKINPYSEKEKILLIDKRVSLYGAGFEVEKFIDDVLIPLSEKLDNIFDECKKEAKKEINRKNNALSKQYEILKNFLNQKQNKEGGSDE